MKQACVEHLVEVSLSRHVARVAQPCVVMGRQVCGMQLGEFTADLLEGFVSEWLAGKVDSVDPVDDAVWDVENREGIIEYHEGRCSHSGPQRQRNCDRFASMVPQAHRLVLRYPQDPSTPEGPERMDHTRRDHPGNGSVEV